MSTPQPVPQQTTDTLLKINSARNGSTVKLKEQKNG